MIASGSVDDYTADVRSSIIKAFAERAQVAESDVMLQVTAASVNLEVVIVCSTRDASDAVTRTIQPMLSSSTGASVFLPEGLTVESVPVVEVIDVAGESPMTCWVDGVQVPCGDEFFLVAAGMPIGILAGAAAGGLLLVAIAVVVWRRHKAKAQQWGPIELTPSEKGKSFHGFEIPEGNEKYILYESDFRVILTYEMELNELEEKLQDIIANSGCRIKRETRETQEKLAQRKSNGFRGKCAPILAIGPLRCRP